MPNQTNAIEVSTTLRALTYLSGPLLVLLLAAAVAGRSPELVGALLLLSPVTVAVLVLIRAELHSVAATSPNPLAQRLADCRREEARIQSEIRDLQLRRTKQIVARDRLAASRLRDRAVLFQRAVDLLDQQIARRLPLLDDWAALRGDLEALVSAEEAEAALAGFDMASDLARIEDETARLTAATDAVMAEDAVSGTLVDGR